MSLFFRRSEETDARAKRLRSAIIDIGSNSVRLVVYEGPPRIPEILFNEKVMAGLGRSLGETGAIDRKASDVALRALARFKRVAEAMAVGQLRTVATAAVRDASNGAKFVAGAAALGLDIETLSGEQEAVAAANGVLSAIPDADGIVGDLGGGSLELVRIKGGQVIDGASFPLGVLRLGAIRAGTRGALDRRVAAMLGKVPWLQTARGLPFYLVGGSWRALARVDMVLTDYPLPIMHQYRMEPAAAARLVRSVARIDKQRLKAITALAGSRIATLGEGAALLSVLARRLKSSGLIVSAFGLREGLLFEALSSEERALDPLIVACREEGERQGRFAEHGDLLDRWISPLFAGDDGDARLRHAACLLSDVAWRANPDFRAERGLEAAIHGNWVAIDARGRAMLGQALFTSFGGGGEPIADFAALASEADLRRAAHWGLAIRLGQRLSGGVAGPLDESRLAVENEGLCLALAPEDRELYGEAVERRHKQLASALDLQARMASLAPEGATR